MSDHPSISTPPSAPVRIREQRSRAPGGRLRRAFFRLVAALHRWAESGWSGPAVFTYSFLQGSVMPGPSDALLVALGIADPRRVWRLAAWGTVGAVAGGVVSWSIGAFAFEEVGQPLLALVGLDPADIDRSRALFDRHGSAFVALSAMSPISTKITCIAAGALGVPLSEFLVGIFVGRAVRFLAVAALLYFAGERLTKWMERKLGKPIEMVR